MDGSGIYFPCAVVFMAYMSGNSEAITSGALATLAIVSTLGAVGASPIPNSGIVMVSGRVYGVSREYLGVGWVYVYSS